MFISILHLFLPFWWHLTYLHTHTNTHTYALTDMGWSDRVFSVSVFERQCLKLVSEWLYFSCSVPRSGLANAALFGSNLSLLYVKNKTCISCRLYGYKQADCAAAAGINPEIEFWLKQRNGYTPPQRWCCQAPEIPALGPPRWTLTPDRSWGAPCLRGPLSPQCQGHSCVMDSEETWTSPQSLMLGPSETGWLFTQVCVQEHFYEEHPLSWVQRHSHTF